jgi:hypothetical protein
MTSVLEVKEDNLRLIGSATAVRPRRENDKSAQYASALCILLAFGVKNVRCAQRARAAIQLMFLEAQITYEYLWRPVSDPLAIQK